MKLIEFANYTEDGHPHYYRVPFWPNLYANVLYRLFKIRKYPAMLATGKPVP